MKAFRYIAKSGPGNRVEGVMEGESASGVSRALVTKGLFPVEVTEIFSEGGVLNQFGVLKGIWKRNARILQEYREGLSALNLSKKYGLNILMMVNILYLNNLMII